MKESWLLFSLVWISLCSFRIIVCEKDSSVITMIWFFTSVFILVLYQIIFSWEYLLTQITLIWVVSSVCHNIFCKFIIFWDGLFTLIKIICFFHQCASPCVVSYVCRVYFYVRFSQNDYSDMISPQYELSCVDVEHLYWWRLSHNDCIDLVFPLCETSYAGTYSPSMQSIFHIGCIDILFPTMSVHMLVKSILKC